MDVITDLIYQTKPWYYYMQDLQIERLRVQITSVLQTYYEIVLSGTYSILFSMVVLTKLPDAAQ